MTKYLDEGGLSRVLNNLKPYIGNINVGGSSGVQMFTTSGTWVTDGGLFLLIGQAGGSSGSYRLGYSGKGGSSGACFIALRFVEPGSWFYSIGAGGASPLTNNTINGGGATFMQFGSTDAVAGTPTRLLRLMASGGTSTLGGGIGTSSANGIPGGNDGSSSGKNGWYGITGLHGAHYGQLASSGIDQSSGITGGGVSSQDVYTVNPIGSTGAPSLFSHGGRGATSISTIGADGMYGSGGGGGYSNDSVVTTAGKGGDGLILIIPINVNLN